MEIVATGMPHVLGDEILSLDEYMKRRKFIPEIDCEIEDFQPLLPHKKVKGASEQILEKK